jgi:hypothetical protein
MGFLSRLFGRRRPEQERPPASPSSEHAVLVHLRLSDDQFGASAQRDSIHELATELEHQIERARAGEFDGDEFGDGECTLFMYGPDADRLFAVIEEPLRASVLARGGFVIKRYGAAADSSVREVRVEL